MKERIPQLIIASMVIALLIIFAAVIYPYVASGEPMDKAGAYGIQGGAALFADQMHGDYYNVMGLPVQRLYATLKELI